jgi:hypothetical protein
MALRGLVSQTNVRRFASGKGSGRSMIASTTLKMAVLAPIPTARTATITPVINRFFAMVRIAYRSSKSISTPHSRNDATAR